MACFRTRSGFGSPNKRIEFLKNNSLIENKSWIKSIRSFIKRLHWHCHFIQKLEADYTIEFKNMHSLYDGLREKEFKDMFNRVSKNSLVKDIGAKNEEQFCNNMYGVFEGREPHIANAKLMQLYFIDKLLKLKESDQNEYLTDLLFIAQKKGNKVFDFGPFGKLY